MNGPLRAVAVALVLPLLGCYGYIPTEMERLTPGQQVLVHLTRQGLADIPELPNQRDNALRGRVVSRSPEALVMRVPIGEQRSGLASEAIGQDVTVPAPEIIDVGLRTLSKSRTVLMVAVGVAAAVTAITSFGEVDNEIGPGEGETESIRIPLFFVSVP